MNSWNLVDILRRGEELGLSDVLLPFLLLFAIVFGVLQSTNVLGKSSKNLNIVLAMVIGLALVVPHVMNIYPDDKDPVKIINTAIPNISFVMIILFSILLVIGIFGAESKSHSGATFAIIVIGSILVIFFLNETYPNIAPIVLAVAVFLTIGLGFFRKRDSDRSKVMPGWIFIIAFAVVFVIFLNAAGWTQLPNWLDFLNDSRVQMVMVVLIVIFAVVGFITRETNSNY